MKILLPVDGSEYSRSAVDFVATRVSLLGKKPEMELLNVQPEESFWSKLISRRKGGEETHDSKSIFRYVENAFGAHGLGLRKKVLRGKAAEAIAEECRRFGADLIIMGSRGLSPYQGLFMGSVSTGVIARTSTPVLLLRGGEPPAGEKLTVGIAIDGTDYGAEAARYVADNIDLFGSVSLFVAIYVVTRQVEESFSVAAACDGTQLTKEDYERLSRLALEKAMQPIRKILEEAGITAREVVLRGDPRDEIPKYAEKHRVDLVVMGSHGYDNFDAAVRGSVAMAVASEGEVPLLLVQKEEPEVAGH